MSVFLFTWRKVLHFFQASLILWSSYSPPR
jgi:hypothetical protein